MIAQHAPLRGKRANYCYAYIETRSLRSGCVEVRSWTALAVSSWPCLYMFTVLEWPLAWSAGRVCTSSLCFKGVLRGVLAWTQCYNFDNAWLL